MRPAARLSVDIGGTFTDLVLLRDDGACFTGKVSSTPLEPENALITGMLQLLAKAGLKPNDLTEVLHGTTVGSNTLLQKAGARCGLITTKGFRDVLEIGRLRTPGMFDLTWDKPEPLVARRYRLEIDERATAVGEILRPVRIEEVIEAGRFFAAEGIGSVAICFLNSYKNPANERVAADTLARAFPALSVTASIEVLPEAGEYERTSTTVVNAYVLPSLRSYLGRLEQKLRSHGVKAPLLIGNSNGGLSSARVAQAKPVFFISSGRSSGAVGGARLGAATGEGNLVIFDMGGTTASAALVHRGVLSRTHEYEFRAGMSVPSRFIKAGGYMMRVPTVDVAEVGNGAGSIAAIDPGGLLTVGPRSAGARPGPVCYRQGGTQPTVTDANIVLGLLPPALAGGSLPLDIDAAREAIARVLGKPLGLSVEAAALGIREVANINMVRAIRAVTVERGLDPRDLKLMAIGGSGPVHACDVARTLGISQVLFPPTPGVFTAMGMLAGTIEHHELRSAQLPLSDLKPERVAELQLDMQQAALAALAAQGYPAAKIAFRHTIHLRLQGQDASIPVPIAAEPGEREIAALRVAFINLYRDTYGYSPSDAIEMVSLRLHAEGKMDGALDFTALRGVRAIASVSQAFMRAVYFAGTGWRDTPIVSRDDFVGETEGPIILESADTTIVIPPSVMVALTSTGSLLATLKDPA